MAKVMFYITAAVTKQRHFFEVVLLLNLGDSDLIFSVNHFVMREVSVGEEAKKFVPSPFYGSARYL